MFAVAPFIGAGRQCGTNPCDILKVYECLDVVKNKDTDIDGNVCSESPSVAGSSPSRFPFPSASIRLCIVTLSR